MMLTVFKISLLRLWNNKHELLLIFVVPVMFFSIFAMIFSRGVGTKVKQVSVSIVNDDTSPRTARVIRSLLENEEIRRVTGIGNTSPDWPIYKLARAIIGSLEAEVVIYFPPSNSGEDAQETPIQILNEGTNPISARVVEAALSQAIVSESRPQRISPPASSSGLVQFASSTLPELHDQVPVPIELEFEHQSVFASNKHQPKIAMYAAGIAVMFLLFSSSGAGASLLEEKEAGTLERLMGSRLSLGELLAGKWIYIAALGFVQLSVMFLWGQLVFSVDLLGHLPGFVAMSVATTAAAASFALFLAVICKSRNQLNGVALVVVLTMSALGGSMIPRYIMSESMQKMGKLTFNGWALDGYKKIFWYDLPVTAIQTEICVLLGIAIVFGFAARMAADKWSLQR